METTRWCNEKVVALLLSWGATVVGKKGVLTHPARLGRESLVKLLLDYGADMFEGDPDPFVSAIFLEHTSLFRLMMEKKGVLREEVGRQCLRKAQEDGLESMIELLREYGVNADEVLMDKYTVTKMDAGRDGERDAESVSNADSTSSSEPAGVVSGG
ncbi:hypothetical protein BS50DRAFT_574277 [Corynespora cassiicola Philippines]|uniref:Ankyrin n=1 Tax=Corynespora cassiicola Philippines TaxID=1448308 RepID=A0A2T2NL11_CORCC|nr:hypothetical protein BS50DRAFT_574277 [Corynespora cassiicola Philippines]